MRIVFMGTPEFALPSLEALIERGHEIAAVFCQPDRPAGRAFRPTLRPRPRSAGSRASPSCSPNAC